MVVLRVLHLVEQELITFIKSKLPIFLAILLYILIYLLRLQQIGGLEGKTSLKQPDSGVFLQLREDLDKQINQYLPTPQSELLSGILLGNKKDLPAELKLNLRDTSTLHIVVVSGQNLTMVAGLFLGLAGILKRKTAILISILAVLFYTFLTGAQIPVVRAAIMAILAFSAQLFGRQRDGVWLLLVTGGVMLLFQPQMLLDLSFQLSFLATFGVIVLAPILASKLGFLPSFLKIDLAVTVGAQLMVLPVLSQNFHQLSLVSVFANLLVGWVVPIIMILGSLMLAGGLVAGLVGTLISFLVNALLTYFIYIVEFFAQLPFSWEYIGEQSILVWIGYYCLLGAGLLALNKIDGGL